MADTMANIVALQILSEMASGSSLNSAVEVVAAALRRRVDPLLLGTYPPVERLVNEARAIVVQRLHLGSDA